MSKMLSIVLYRAISRRRSRPCGRSKSNCAVASVDHVAPSWHDVLATVVPGNCRAESLQQRRLSASVVATDENDCAIAGSASFEVLSQEREIAPSADERFILLVR